MCTVQAKTYFIVNFFGDEAWREAKRARGRGHRGGGRMKGRGGVWGSYE